MIIIWAMHMEYTGDNTNADVVLVEKSECEVPLGKPRCR